MQDSLFRFLQRISLNESYYSVLETAIIEKVTMSKEEPKFYNIYLKVDNVLDIRVFNEILSHQVLDLPFKLIIESFYKPNEIDCNSYYQYYLTNHLKNNINYDLLSRIKLVLDQENILVELPNKILFDAFNSFKEKLTKFFYNSGIRFPLNITYKQINEEELDSLISGEITKAKEQTIAPQTFGEIKKTINYDYIKKGYVQKKIKDVEFNDSKVEIFGKVFKAEMVVSKSGNKSYTFSVYDKSDSIEVLCYEGKYISQELLSSIKEDSFIRVKGYVKDNGKGTDFRIVAENIEIVDYDDRRKDESLEKRVELHLHTTMSAMDGVATIEKYCQLAAHFGHKAIAITDHGVIHAFPDAQNAAKKYGLKMIYGMEGYVIDNCFVPCINPIDKSLDDATYVVFDLETTGLSSHYDNIIEFGALKIRHGQEIDRMQTFINPKTKLSNVVSELTGITDEMLIGAPTIEQCIDKIITFIGDSVLVAHNGTFDYGFINEALRKLNRPLLRNCLVETLDLSHILFPDYKKFALGDLCDKNKISYASDEAHRADYDAEVLSKLFNVMLDLLHKENVTNFTELNGLSHSDAYKYKNHPYHMSILARNAVGLKNLYRLVSISHTEHINKFPIIFREEIQKYREGLLIGSACFNSEVFEIAQTKSHEELRRCISFYDYIELQPLDNYEFLIKNRKIVDKEKLIMILKDIALAAQEEGKVIVATGDCHYLNEEDKIFRDIFIIAKTTGVRNHPLYTKYNKESPKQHFRTTQEMIDGMSYLEDPSLIRDIVIKNSNYIADMCEEIIPFKGVLCTPHLAGIDTSKEIARLCDEKIKRVYGDNPPEWLIERKDKELTNICNHGYSVIYYIAYRLVKKCNEDGFIVGSRGSVGSSFVAYLCDITEVNPLKPHYVCPHCKHSEFFEYSEVKSGYDLPDKACPECGTIMKGDGHNIPFEVFLGFDADKVPDIDLNFSNYYQSRAHDYSKVLLGDKNTFRAGTISTIADKKALALVLDYLEDRNIVVNHFAEKLRLANNCLNVKVTTGKHAGGVVVIPDDMDVLDFTPYQYPANDTTSSWYTTHFDFESIHDEVLKLDLLGHLDPTALNMLGQLTGVDITKIPTNDPKVLSIFNSVESLGVDPNDVENNIGITALPEFGTGYAKQIVQACKPTKFSDLVHVSGLGHGDGVWGGNAQTLMQEGTCSLEETIGSRDEIMAYCIDHGIDRLESFNIMENVRKKGKTLKPEQETLMREHGVPEWYINSCKKIVYMYPKAHAVAYVLMSYRVAWFKVYYPLEFYATFFSIRCDHFDLETVLKGKEEIRKKKHELEDKARFSKLDPKEKELQIIYETALEMYARGYKFVNIRLDQSYANDFRLDKEHNALIPPFNSLKGLGDEASKSIVEARDFHEFVSKQDLLSRTKISKTHLKLFIDLGIIDSLKDEDNIRETFTLF